MISESFEKTVLDSRAKVRILGREYTLKGDVDPDYMLKVSRYVDQRLQEMKENIPTLDITKLSLLVSLNLADELFQARQDENRLDSTKLNEMAEKAENLITMIEKGIVGEEIYHDTALAGQFT